jgi:hypothetical protein
LGSAFAKLLLVRNDGHPPVGGCEFVTIRLRCLVASEALFRMFVLKSEFDVRRSTFAVRKHTQCRLHFSSQNSVRRQTTSAKLRTAIVTAPQAARRVRKKTLKNAG